MILIGQYDSPFTRRVAIALALRPRLRAPAVVDLGDADKIAPFNPLQRVPTLVFEDGEVLIESSAILDYLDEVVGPSKAMIAESGPERRHALKICALATGLGDKAVSLIYERVLRKDELKLWVERCEAQISGVLDVLESERAAILAILVRDPHRTCRHRGRLRAAVHRRSPSPPASAARYPALVAHGARCEALPPFREIVQPLSPPSG
jgi:glutathione S-transferase